MLEKIISRFIDVSVYRYISELESRVDELEMENVNTTNALYELENRLQAKIDKIQPVVYNIVNKDTDVRRT
jgi:hypothetical protein